MLETILDLLVEIGVIRSGEKTKRMKGDKREKPLWLKPIMLVFYLILIIALIKVYVYWPK